MDSMKARLLSLSRSCAPLGYTTKNMENLTPLPILFLSRNMRSYEDTNHLAEIFTSKRYSKNLPSKIFDIGGPLWIKNLHPGYHLGYSRYVRVLEDLVPLGRGYYTIDEKEGCTPSFKTKETCDSRLVVIRERAPRK